MLIHGKERGFKLTVGASRKISQLCPDKDIKNIGKLFQTADTTQMIDYISIICASLSEGYEMMQKFSQKDYEMDPLTVEEILSLGIDEISLLQDEMMATLERDLKTEVNPEPVPQKGKKTRKKASQ